MHTTKKNYSDAEYIIYKKACGTDNKNYVYEEIEMNKFILVFIEAKRSLGEYIIYMSYHTVGNAHEITLLSALEVINDN